jgi:protein O-GlcNAc transferase
MREAEREVGLLLQAGMAAQARQKLQPLLKKHPTHTRLRLLAAAAAQKLADLPDLAGHLLVILDHEPAHQQAVIGLAGLASRVEMDAASLRKVEQGLRMLTVSMPPLLPSWAGIAVRLGMPAEFVGELERRITVAALTEDFAKALVDTAMVLQEAGELEWAIALLRYASGSHPENWRLSAAAGLLLHKNKEHADAFSCLDRALDLAAVQGVTVPVDVELALIASLASQQQHEQAWNLCVELLKRAPDNVEVLLQVVQIGLQNNRVDDAAVYMKRALELAPGSAMVRCYHGALLFIQREQQSAIEETRAALAIDPGLDAAWSNLAAILIDLNEMEEAEEAARRALALNPSLARANRYLGLCLRDSFRQLEALTYFRHAIKLDPHDLSNWRGYLFSANYPEEISAEELFAEHVAFGKLLAEQEVHPIPMPAKGPERKLRIGFVSGDLRRHSVGYFMLPIYRELAANYRDQFELISIATKPDDESSVSLQFRELSDEWLNITDVPFGEIVPLLRSLSVDIMIDLAGHTIGERLLAFAHRVAPLQINYLGYPNTTGIEAMDCRISDHHADPVGVADRFCTERLLRMPECMLCYHPIDDTDEAEVVPAPAVTPSSFVRFGSFNNISKLTPQHIGRWAEILKRVPDSKLVLKSKGIADPAIRNRLFTLFREAGIDPERRLDLRASKPKHAQHLATYHDVDIALDTFPYGGTTTTCEALLMGVPVLTMTGDCHASRVTSSILQSVGRPEWITTNESDYIAKAVSMAAEVSDLRDLRLSLSKSFRAAPICDSREFVNSLAGLLRDEWRKCCKGRND